MSMKYIKENDDSKGHAGGIDCRKLKGKEKMKDLRVLRSSRIFSDGRHNAFTSIAACGEALFIAFRSASAHLAQDGRITVIKSLDGGKVWAPCAEIILDNWDLRDPGVIFFAETLHLFCFGRKSNALEVTASFHCQLKEDGTFSAPETVNGLPVIWDVDSFDGKLYCSAYYSDENKVSHVTLHTSCDGVNWELLRELPFPGNEASIDFDPDGTMWLLVRDTHNCRCYGGGSIPVLCRLAPPYTGNFNSFPLALRLQGPMLKRVNGASIIAGRRWDGWERNRRNLRTDLFLIADGQDVRFVATLPSGGDTSYASCLERPGKRLLLSYYSSHEHKMDVPFEEDDPKDPAKAEHSTPADIFLAEIAKNF